MQRHRAPTFFKVEIRRSTRLPARASSPELALADGQVAAAERLFGRPTILIPRRVIDCSREVRAVKTKTGNPVEGHDEAAAVGAQPVRVLPDLRWSDPVEERIRQEEEDRGIQ